MGPVRSKIAILGAGSIGSSFGVLFAKAGFSVVVWDPFPEALERARGDIDARLRLLDSHSLLSDEVDSIASRITYDPIFGNAVKGAILIQECAPEDLNTKTNLFKQLASTAPTDAVMASSSSALTPTRFATEECSQKQIIVAHPGNPPYLLPVIEIVPGPLTSSQIVERAIQIYREAGLKPVLLKKEIDGFLFNRLQGAVLREAYCLVRDGVASVEDIDEVVRSGLGRRWSFMGPFETVDLNTRGGIASHAQKMGPAYEAMGAERGQYDPWTPDLVATVAQQRRSVLPLDLWDERVRWRDEQLMRLTSSLHIEKE